MVIFDKGTSSNRGSVSAVFSLLGLLAVDFCFVYRVSHATPVSTIPIDFNYGLIKTCIHIMHSCSS